MARPLFAVDNMLNPRIYPGHTLSASSTLAGTSVLNLSSGRRIARAGLGGWFASALNTAATVTCIFDRLRAFSLLWIDRDHNLDGQTVSVSISDDDFATSATVASKVVPTAPTPYSGLYGGEFVRTNEGALLLWLGVQAAWGVRVSIGAMGVGLRPELAGMGVFSTWAPVHAQQKPADFGRYAVLRQITRSPQAQSAASDVGRYRGGEIRLRAASWAEYSIASYHLEELYLRGHAMVVVHSDTRAEEALLAVAPAAQAGFEVPGGQYLPEMAVGYEETEPVLL